MLYISLRLSQIVQVEQPIFSDDSSREAEFRSCGLSLMPIAVHF